jgi:hypothetical protein
MPDLDIASLFCKSLILFLYGSVFVLSILFTFYEEHYNRITQLLNLEFLSFKILTPLERNIYIIDDWVAENKKITGPVLIFFSLCELVLLLNIIDELFITI